MLYAHTYIFILFFNKNTAHVKQQRFNSLEGVILFQLDSVVWHTQNSLASVFVGFSGLFIGDHVPKKAVGHV